MSYASNRFDIYEIITNQIIFDLEQGVRAWVRPWNNSGGGFGTRPVNKDFKPYAGINVLILWMAAESRGYSNSCWMTFKQAADLGGKVRKGETGTKICYYQPAVNSREASEDGAETQRKAGFLKVYTVFNVTQIDGLPGQYAPKEVATVNVSKDGRIASADAFVEATKADVRIGGNSAFYAPAADYIQMPPLEAFSEAQGYYAVLMHELAHWTSGGKGSRLEREFGNKRWGDAGYAMEELVAELAAAFLCADLGLNLVEREDHSAYIASWLKVLKNDKRAIFTAAAHAQKAAQFLHDLQPKHANDDAPLDSSAEETPRLAA